MEALSPRSTNIQARPKLSKLKEKELADEEAKRAEAAKKALKEKDYAPAPPEWVLQPPINKGGLAEKFRTGKCLGKGGFAICYEGELRNKGRGAGKTIFALKIVKTYMSLKKMEDKFRTELQIHAKMRHPNIVEFHRAFTFKDSTYVVLELCSNGSIMDMVKKRRCLTLPEVRRLTVQLCGAIKYMHARNVIHRDLKMGNLFLDHDMNLKIGDFGLAAVLVSKHEYQGLYDQKSRRTTLCGTPNYIAPEILEKGRGGHDHKVDIWAIGVIMFAMLVGQPPFQAASQNEIYRKARGVEYDWPEKNKHFNDIPEEAKDLVARLLKVDAEERPDPDQVVGHPFFSMHGGDAMPMVMEEYFCREFPHYLDRKTSPRGDVMLKGTERLSLRALARQCGVGCLPGDREPQVAVGGDVDLSLYKECQAEEDSGNAPVVPLPKDMVYTSKFASSSSPNSEANDSSQSTLINSHVMEDVDTSRSSAAISQSSTAVAETMSNRSVPERPRRALIPSHAATLRAAHVSSGTQLKQILEHAGPNDSSVRTKASANASVRARRGLLNELPVRPTLNASSAGGLEAKALARNPRATRAKKVHVLDEETVDPPVAPKARRPPTKDHCVDHAYSNPDVKTHDMAARSRARIASNVQKEMADVVPLTRTMSSEMTSNRARKRSDSPRPENALIGPDEVLECLPESKPDDVLRQLQRLHNELEISLKELTRGKAHSQLEDFDVRSQNFKQRPVVVKWVDYTNKFGIGYILANGTVGCVFKGDETSNPTCVVVAGAEDHLKKRNVAKYREKKQMVHARGAPIEFIENCGLDGLKRVLVPASQYQVPVSDAGVADKLAPGRDIHDYEKRRKLCLWDKFGKYMTQSLGKSEEIDVNSPEEADSSRSRRNNVAGPFVKFYQRLGNVGIWGFGDGSFQFNFPDHTKIVVSGDGTWLDFYHLPIQAAKALKTGRILEAGALAARSVLCYPTSVMLSGSYRGHEFKELVRENELDAKTAFVRDVVGLWAKEGGLGCMGRKEGVKWEGMLEEGGKLVWVTVGAKGGDTRYEMPATGT
ncbi:hypothetical protein HO173_008332 [Letharia columbiana]|uniref:Protein kinase domain-containing protein n=1 Tax=Letharia columbiana TaxID=112416 RepID=A0A8H6L2S6_9LECA|nr:uncharacterized protein HO173_008332 [Letharia columbiana]KAF6233400.1 hypothetical protein HO173_008332 [Letharia columbiana]